MSAYLFVRVCCVGRGREHATPAADNDEEETDDVSV